MPPGWQPAGVGGGPWAKPAFDLRRVRTYDPPMDPRVRAFALLQLVVAIGGAVPLLWSADELSRATLLAGALAIVGVLWATGAVMQGRVRLRSALTVEAGIALVALSSAALL
jgi:hypothetical protein